MVIDMHGAQPQPLWAPQTRERMQQHAGIEATGIRQAQRLPCERSDALPQLLRQRRRCEALLSAGLRCRDA
jgi:hypothetical protein